MRDAGVETPIFTNASVNGTLVTEVAGQVSNFWALGLRVPADLLRGHAVPSRSCRSPTQFKAKYGQPIGNHYALPGYALADAIVAAIRDGRLDRRHEDRGRSVRRPVSDQLLRQPDEVHGHVPPSAAGGRTRSSSGTNGKDTQIGEAVVKSSRTSATAARARRAAAGRVGAVGREAERKET